MGKLVWVEGICQITLTICFSKACQCYFFTDHFSGPAERSLGCGSVYAKKNFQMKITYLFVSFIWVCQISGQFIFRMGTETHGRTACDNKNNLLACNFTEF